MYVYNASGKGIDIIVYSKIFWKCIEQFSSSIKRTIFHETYQWKVKSVKVITDSFFMLFSVM